jgi:hypothetical protein
MRLKLPLLSDSPAPLTAERLFREQFLPSYPPGVSLEALRRTDANPAKNPAIERAAVETALLFAKLAPEALGRQDLDLDLSDASVHRLSAALTAEARARLFAARAAPGEPPLLVHFVAHGALYVALCIARNHGATWLFRSPLWETRVRLVSRAGEAELAPFSWWLAALSDDGVGKHALADRYRTLVEVPCEDAYAWPVVFDPHAKLPRLAKPKYHAFAQWLEAHLAEVSDLGLDFPSPERFTELDLRYLCGVVVGGGRAVLVHGAGAKGVHAFWLGPHGFSKAVFFEADPVPEPRVTLGESAQGDQTVRFSFCKSGAPAEVELLWWGP